MPVHVRISGPGHRSNISCILHCSPTSRHRRSQDFTLGGTEAERRRRENRRAESPRGVGLGGSVPLPNRLGCLRSVRPSRVHSVVYALHGALWRMCTMLTMYFLFFCFFFFFSVFLCSLVCQFLFYFFGGQL